MSEAWVVNASPLILLARIGRLDLFERLAATIIVPNAVRDEVRAGDGRDASAATALAWIEPRSTRDVIVPTGVEHWDLGAGESQVIAHGLAGSRWVVLDDRAARRCAVTHDLPVIGSLGVVLRAKKRGVLEVARPWVTKLIAAGMFVDAQLMTDALATVQE